MLIYDSQQGNRRGNKRVYLGQAHEVATRCEDENAAAKQVVSDTVHKLTCSQATQKLLLPLDDGLEPVLTPLEHVSVQPHSAVLPHLQMIEICRCMIIFRILRCEKKLVPVSSLLLTPHSTHGARKRAGSWPSREDNP